MADAVQLASQMAQPNVIEKQQPIQTDAVSIAMGMAGQNQPGELASQEGLDVAGVPVGSIEEMRELSTGDASDVMLATWRDTLLGYDQGMSESERDILEAQVADYQKRNGFLKTLGVAILPGLAGDLPADLLVSKGFGSLARLGKIAKMANRAPLDKATRFVGREMLEGAMAATVSEASQIALYQKETSPEMFKLRVISEALASPVMAGAMRGVGMGIPAVKEMLTRNGISPETADASIARAVEIEGDNTGKVRTTSQIDQKDGVATSRGEEIVNGEMTKALDQGRPVDFIHPDVGEVRIIPSTEDFGAVRNAVQASARDFGLEVHMFNRINADTPEGFAIGNKVFIDAAANDADFERLLGHELFHTWANKTDLANKTSVVSTMKDMMGRAGRDVDGLDNRVVIEEFFADAAGRRGRAAIEELTRDMSSTQQGRTALQEFYDFVRDFIDKVRGKAGMVRDDELGAPKFESAPELQEIDDFAERMLRELLVPDDTPARAEVDGDVKQSKLFQRAEAQAVPQLEGVVEGDEIVDIPVDATEAQLNEYRAKGVLETVRDRETVKAEVATMTPERGQNKWTKMLRTGFASKGQQFSRYMEGLGLGSFSRLVKDEHTTASSLKNIVHDDHVAVLANVPEEMQQRMSNTSAKMYDDIGLELTEGQRAYMIMLAREQDAGKTVDGDEVKGVDKDTGFGRKSAAAKMHKYGVVDSKNNRVTLSKEQIDDLAADKTYEDVIAVYRTDVDNAGKIGDHAALRAGNDRVTDPTITQYVSILTEDMGRDFSNANNPFDFGDRSIWKSRNEGATTIDMSRNINPLVAGKRIADSSAQLYGDVGIKNAEAALFGSGGQNTGMTFEEFVETIAPQDVRSKYDAEIENGLSREQAISKSLSGTEFVMDPKLFKKKENKSYEPEKATVLFKPKSLGHDINKKLGPNAAEEVRSRIQQTYSSRFTKDVLGPIASAVMRLKRVSTLGWNTTALLQVASSPYSTVNLIDRIGQRFPEVANALNAREMAANVGKAISDKGYRDSTMEQAMQDIPAFKERMTSGNVDIEFAELAENKAAMGQFKKMWRQAKRSQGYKGNFDAYLKLIEESMGPIREVDRMTITGMAGKLMQVAEESGLKRGTPSYYDFVNKSFMDVLETQPTSIKGFKNEWQLSDSPFARAFTMFTGATGPMYGLMHEAALRFSQGDTQFARELMVPMLMSIGYVATIGTASTYAKGLIFQTEEDRKAIEGKFGGPLATFANRIAGSTVGTIPLIGPAAGGALGEVFTGHSFDSSHPVFDYYNDTVKFVGEMSDFEVGDALYRVMKNVMPYPVSRFARRVGKEIAGE